jgi:hypothetical protein
MNKKTTFLVMILFFNLAAFSQSKESTPTKDATFCGKIGQGGAPPEGSFSVEELKNCDWKIIPLDSNLTVIEFRMSLVPKDKLYSYTEKKITGNAIPVEYKNQILNQTKSVYLEYIKAIDKQGQQETIKPIAIRIQ